MANRHSTSAINYENRVVAFIDILGFREFVTRSKHDDTLAATLHGAITNYTGEVLDYIIESADDIHWPIISSFSDCIVISSTADDKGLATVFLAASEIVVRLQYAGLLCRGGLDVGKFYHDEKAAFGPALVKAYELESKHARYPQVVLSAEAVDLLDNVCAVNACKEYFSNVVVRDGATKLMRLDPYAIFEEENVINKQLLGFSVSEFCATAKGNIVAGLREGFDNPGIIDKYEWAAEQIGRLIKRLAPEVGEITPKDIFQNFSLEAAN